MALLLLLVLAPIVLVLAVWHYAGYATGRYARWSAEQESTRATL